MRFREPLVTFEVMRAFLFMICIDESARLGIVFVQNEHSTIFLVFKQVVLKLNHPISKMKKTFILFALGAILASCGTKKNDNQDSNESSDTSINQVEKNPNPAAAPKDSINWEKVPELKNIGDFPFFKPEGKLFLANEKNNLTEYLDYAKMENYTGSAVYTTRGKLGMMSFQEQGETPFNKMLFDDQVDEFITKTGAEKIYRGEYPREAQEGIKLKLKENLWNGKVHTLGIADDEPFGVYAFKHNGKKYMFSFQSNSAQGKLFIMEVN